MPLTYKPAHGVLTTVERFKAQWGIAPLADDAPDQLVATADLSDSNIANAIRAASRIIGEECGRQFIPYLATLGHEADPQGWVALADELLALSGDDPVTLDTVAVDEDDYQLLEPNDRPFTSIYNANGWPAYTEPSASGLKLTGWWGYHPDPDSMWAAVTTVTSGLAVSAAATTCVVADDSQIGTFDYIKIESEVLFVEAIDRDTLTLTVKRGQRGTTAAVHANATSVSLYQIDDAVRKMATSYATYLYDTDDNNGTVVQDGPDGSRPVRKRLPDFVRDGLAVYYHELWGTP